jgi:hypothetical protein
MVVQENQERFKLIEKQQLLKDTDVNYWSKNMDTPHEHKL